MKTIGIACLVACVLAPLAANAQSFSCRDARMADEIAICSNAGLSALDVRLAVVYERLKARLSGSARQSLINDEIVWIETRRTCGSNTSCIENAYRRRIAELGG